MRIGDICTFKGTVKRVFCDKPNFRACSVSVDEVEQGVLIKHPTYNTVSVHGEFQEVKQGSQYSFEIEYEGENQYGHQYRATRVSIERPTTPQQIEAFLSEIISVKRAKEVVRVYPNIIDMVLKDEKIDTSKMKGIGDKVIENIKNKIIDNIGCFELHKVYGHLGLTFPTLSKILKRYKTVDNAIYNFDKNPYDALTQIHGIGFIKADEIALKLNPSFINSLERMTACITYYLSENENNGNTYMGLDMLHSECLTHVQESIAYFRVALDSQDIYYEEDTKRVSRMSTRKKEEYIAEKLLLMDNLAEKWEVDIEQFRKVSEEVSLTNQQISVLRSVSEHGVTCLTGYAGCGKSQSVASCVSMLRSLGKSYKLCTPTAKSADVLADFTHEDVKTIHRTLGYNGSGFEYNEECRLGVDVVIVDEVSMVDLNLFYALLKAIDEKTTRILLVGDPSQLPSIGAGNILNDLTTSGVIIVNELNKVFRYGDGGLMRIATDIRNGVKFLDSGFTGSKAFGANKDFCYTEIDQDYMVDNALTYYKKLLDNGNTTENVAIITNKNVSKFGTIEINRKVQAMLQEGKTNEKIVVNDGLTLYLGDKVKQKVNNYDIEIVGSTYNNDLFGEENEEENNNVKGEVYNGQTGVVTHIDNYNKLIHVRIKGVEYVYKKDMISEQLVLGYCVTTTSSQGMSIDYVITLLPRADTFMASSNALYTAVTRSRIRCYLLGNINTVNNAIKKKINLTRNTFTKELLVKGGELNA